MDCLSKGVTLLVALICFHPLPLLVLLINILFNLIRGKECDASEPCPSGNSSVMIDGDNFQEQRDEVLALQSIFDDDEEKRINVVSEPDENGLGLFQLQVKIPVVTPTENYRVNLLIPVSAHSSLRNSVGDGPMTTAEEMKEGRVSAEEDGVQEDEGAVALPPPPDMEKRIALQRSLSGHRWTGSFSVRHLYPMTLHLTFPPNYPSEVPPVFALSCLWLLDGQISTLCKQLDLLWEATPNMPVVFSWLHWLENETFRCLGLTNSLVLVSERIDDGDGVEIDGRVLTECRELGQVVSTLLQYSSQQEAIEFCKSMQYCCLCLDEKPGAKFFRLEPCKHHFCYDCLTAHCNLQVSTGTIQLLICPASKCNVMVSPDVLQAILSPDAYIRWETLSLQRSLDEMDDVVYCPRCQAVVIREQDTNLNLGYCLACCFSFCTACDQAWHQGTQCLSELDKLDDQAQHISLKDQRARERYETLRRQAEERAQSIVTIKSKTLRCPHCRIPVEKVEGCNKMTCRCGKSFCWLCGKGITGYDHFKEGGCVLFRYQEPAAEHVVHQRRPPDALLWMQARAEAVGDGGNRQLRCVQCKQLNFKVDNNNHIQCWNCKSHLCFTCRTRITGVITRHFMGSSCPQHS